MNIEENKKGIKEPKEDENVVIMACCPEGEDAEKIQERFS